MACVKNSFGDGPVVPVVLMTCFRSPPHNRRMSCLKIEEDTPHVVRTSNDQLVSSLKDMWEADFRESAFLRDIPRLIKRTQIQTSDFEIHGPYVEDSKVWSIMKCLETISNDMCCDQDHIATLKENIPQ
jgi:hypothetical protein